LADNPASTLGRKHRAAPRHSGQHIQLAVIGKGGAAHIAPLSDHERPIHQTGAISPPVCPQPERSARDAVQFRFMSMNGRMHAASDCIQRAAAMVRLRSNRVPIQTQKCPREEMTMFKVLTAALVAASVLIAPIASTAQAAQPATKAPATTTKVVKLNAHKRHFARHHARVKLVKHVRGHKVVKHVRGHKKMVRAHRHNHVVAKIVRPAPKVRTN
jgi:hypothetical protein